MNKNKILETLLLFGSLAFLVMWVDQFLYKDVDIKDSYFFLMFALAGFLFYTYRRGQRIQQEKKDITATTEESKKKPTVKASITSKNKQQRRK